MCYSLLALILFPMFGAAASYTAGLFYKNLRQFLVVLVTAGEAALTVPLIIAPAQNLHCDIDSLWTFGLHLQLTGFSLIFITLFAFSWLAALLFSLTYFSGQKNQNRYYFFNLMTLGATMGIFLAADLMTVFIFFEIMTFTSYTWIAQNETREAREASNLYLVISVIGGMVALMGLFLLSWSLGTLTISELSYAAQTADTTVLYIAGACLLFGFGAKAGMFPVHIWLPTAYPAAPAPAAALLSGVLTKTGIFGILIVTCTIFQQSKYWGAAVLTLGAITMLLGAILALVSTNLMRTLACSSMSQIGFILIGTGMISMLGHDPALAMRGTYLHMINHTIFKLLLFTLAGIVYLRTQSLDLNKIRGAGKGNRLLQVCFLIGTCGIAGIPLGSGYISKTLLHESIVKYSEVLHHAGGFILPMKLLEWVFLISGGLTLAYMTKLYVSLFHEQNQDIPNSHEKQQLPIPTAAVIALFALIIPILGTMPSLLNRIADQGSDFLGAAPLQHPALYFSWENLNGACISISIGILVYFGIVRKLLMKRQENGIDEYINILPQRPAKQTSLLQVLLFGLGEATAVVGEDRITKPVSSFFLHGLGEATAAVGEDRITKSVSSFVLQGLENATTAVGEDKITKPISSFFLRGTGIITHFFSDICDFCIIFLRKTLFREAFPKSEEHYTRSLAYRMGHFLDCISAPPQKKKRRKATYAERFVQIHETVYRTTHRITGNLSFALLMLCAGVCLVFIYLLFIKDMYPIL